MYEAFTRTAMTTTAHELPSPAYGHAGNADRFGKVPTRLLRHYRGAKARSPVWLVKELLGAWVVDLCASVARRLPANILLFLKNAGACVESVEGDACNWSIRSVASCELAAVAPLEIALRCRGAIPKSQVQV